MSYELCIYLVQNKGFMNLYFELTLGKMANMSVAIQKRDRSPDLSILL